MDSKTRCDCGQEITQEGEFRCYDCWSADTDDAFPANGGRAPESSVLWLVAALALVWFTIGVFVEAVK